VIIEKNEDNPQIVETWHALSLLKMPCFFLKITFNLLTNNILHKYSIMKQIKLFYIFILQITFFSFVNGQGLVNNGEIFHIEEGASIFVDGSFENNSNSQFENNGTVIITGNIKNQQTMPYFSLGTWQFSGTTSQRFTGGVEFDLKNIIFNNPAGFTIGVPTSLKIHGSASFVAGIFGPLSSSYPLIFTDGSKIDATAQPSNTSHINGTVLKDGLDKFTFPIGNGLVYAPITLDLSVNTKGFLAKYSASNIGAGNFLTTGTDPTALIGYNSSEYWDIGPVAGGAATGTVKLYWDGQNETLNSGYSYRKVAHKVGGNWLNEGTNAIGSEASGSVTSNTISNWSPFTVGYIQATALPINLISFSGKKVNQTNVLNWQTSQEINATHFEIERSIDGLKFEKIGKVGLNESKKYEFQDASYLSPVTSNLNYYRLKLLDLDGKFAYSKIINIANEDLTGFQNLSGLGTVGNFYPNPSIDNFTNIDIFSNEKSEWTISNIDVTGRILKTEKQLLQKGINELQITDLKQGINIYQFENKGNFTIRKIIK
jgi:Secretion system C-terminal sorting domain